MNTSPTHRYARVLTIAGSDSGGGAGIQADLKTFSALGCFGMTAITALTAQNTTGVRAIHAVPPKMLQDQIDAVVEDIGVDAVKIGMLHAPDIVQTVASAIDRHRLTQVVLDPVMIATSGAVLIENDALQALVQQLFPRAALITPNLDEAGFLVGHALQTEADMQSAAQALLAQGARAVLLKGGHLRGRKSAIYSCLSMANRAGYAHHASRATTPTAQAAHYLRLLPPIWRLGQLCQTLSGPLTPTYDKLYKLVPACEQVTAAAR